MKIVMDENLLKSILEQLESKQRDCVAFSKKYRVRKMEEQKQYYEGAKWAFDFAISKLKDN